MAEAMTSAWSVRVPASSANLGPGFDALGLALSAYLTCRFRPAETLTIRVTGRDAEEISTGEDNMIWQTALDVARDTGATLTPVEMEVDNGIPLGKGMGSSAAALEPMPLPSGMPLSTSISTGVSVAPVSRATSSAVCQIMLSSPVEISSASRPVTRMVSVSAGRKRQVRYAESASPRASKPGPRFALEAGTRTDHADVIASAITA